MNNKRLKILIVSYTRSDQEPRVLKQIAEFRNTYHVTTAGYGPAPIGADEHIELEPLPQASGLGRIPGIYSLLLLVRMHRQYARLEPRDQAAYRQLSRQTWDVVVAHDAATLFMAFRLESRFGVLADMHEYAPKQSLPSLSWNLLYEPYYSWLCRTYAARAAAVTTVSSGIVDEYKRQFGFDATLVVNATPYAELEPQPVSSPVRLVHSGGVSPQRRLDIMITGVRQSTANVTLDLYLVSDETPLMAQLRSAAAGDPRIRFLEPVPYNELVNTLNGYDVGLSIFPPTTFNLAWCLPNKFFDFVQARLGVIVGPSPEMARFVNQYDIGIVLPDFEPSSLATALEQLTAHDVTAWKATSNRHVHELSGEEQGKIWGRLISNMVAVEPGVAP
ncbi:MAG: glycosyltransferase [Microbacteriaceae bacterium]